MSERRRWTTRRRLGIAMFIVTLVPIWFFSACPRGMLAACFDCSRGHAEAQMLGLPPRWFWEYPRVAKERYGVELRPLGCAVTPDPEWYVSGYNSVSRAHVFAQFGRDVLAECAAEVQAASEHERR